MAYPIIDGLIGAWIVVDGQMVVTTDPVAQFCFVPTEEKMFYEVIRVVEQTPLFWEDHLERLRLSIAGQFAIPETLYQDSRDLIKANQVEHSNLRLVLTEKHTILHQIPSYYPSPEQMQQGVPTGILQWERENPNIKVINSAYKLAVAERFAAGGPFGPLFELLLADRTGELTEGSRSNLFFICGDEVYTAPDSRILKGITRNYVTSAIAAAGGQLVEKMLTYKDIATGAVDAAFLSGSPIDLLPIMAIEDIGLTSAQNPLFVTINQAYQQIVRDYLDSHQA
ncbi:MAG: aminotransferase class IV [Eubacteriales bacterium]|nr:aminotransferase class IV [Eubacteriales bacterium]